jgi:hypothetical protein
MATTKHTCGGPVFGRLARLGQCRRCDELRFGLPAVQWRTAQRRCDDARRLADIRAHDCKASRCGPICTAFDW